MFKTIMMILHVLLSIALITVVILQSGRSAGLSGAITGGAETLFGKKKGMDELLGKVTLIVAVFYAATALVLVIWR